MVSVTRTSGTLLAGAKRRTRTAWGRGPTLRRRAGLGPRPGSDSAANMADFEARIIELWDQRESLAPGDADAFAVVREAIDLLDRGEARVAEIDSNGDVVVHQWLK